MTRESKLTPDDILINAVIEAWGGAREPAEAMPPASAPEGDGEELDGDAIDERDELEIWSRRACVSPNSWYRERMTALPHLTLPVGPRDHIQGGDHATITLVEYGDYECPHCARAYPVVKAVQKRLGKQLRFVFRNFPLNQVHAHAEAAAEIAEAAAVEGKFWEMHDLLFEHQRALEIDDLLGYATKLGLDGQRIVSELKHRKHLPRVKEDYDSGARSGVDGTPAFFINGKPFDGDWTDVESFVAALTR